MMAEAAGLAVGALSIVGLFGSCIDLFKLVHIVQCRDHSIEVLATKLGNQKARFAIWGRSVGLDRAEEDGGYDGRLEEEIRKISVLRTMQLVAKLFDQGEAMRKRYGLRRQWAYRSIMSRRRERAAVWQSLFQRAQSQYSTPKSAKLAGESHSRVPRAHWAIVDRDRFLGLVADLRDLVDDLETLTRFPEVMERRRQIVSWEVASISDAASLSLVAEAADGGAKEISEASTTRLEAQSGQGSRIEIESPGTDHGSERSHTGYGGTASRTPVSPLALHPTDISPTHAFSQATVEHPGIASFELAVRTLNTVELEHALKLRKLEKELLRAECD